MAYIYDLTDTWNAGGTTFYGIKMNVTNTASASGSKLLSLQVGGSEKFGVDKDGNVGVGTSSPTQKLTVSGGSVNADNFYIQTQGASQAGTVGFANANGPGIQFWGSSTGNAGSLTFNTASTERARIDSSGNIGIGTSAPGYRLDIVGNSPNINLKDSTAGVNWYQGPNSSNLYTFGNNAGSPLNTAFLNTNVGIGTSAPGVKLDVIGTVRSTSFTATGTTAFQPQTSMTNWAADATGGYYIFYKGRAGGTTSQNGDTIGTLLWYGHDSGNASVATSSIAVTQTGAASAGVVPTAITFNNGGNAEVMRITNAGNVGIGTSAPGYKLTVNSGDILVSRGSGAAAADGAINFGGNANNYIYSGNSSNIMAFATNGSERMRITADGNLQLGTASLATNATNGFPYIPTCAGTPTGTPTAITGYAPMVVDSTNNKLYVYIGGAWQAMN